MIAIQQNNDNLYFPVSCFFKMNCSETWPGWFLPLNHPRNYAQSINCFVQWAGNGYVCTSYTILAKSEQETKEVSDLFFFFFPSRIKHLDPQTYTWCMNQVTGGHLAKTIIYFTCQNGCLSRGTKKSGCLRSSGW